MQFYVIMPVGADPNSFQKQSIIETNAVHYGIKANLPDYAVDAPIFDLDKTLKSIDDSNFVLADVSLERPSCYYELGLAEALKKEIFIIAEVGTDIHQTFNRTSVRFYNDLIHFEETISDLLVLGQQIEAPV